MFLRCVAVMAVVALTSGCVERVVHERVVHERPVQPEYVEVIAPQPPPERIIEAVPIRREGFIWAHGYWRWDGARYVAIGGHWEALRPGYRYVHPHWEHRPDGWHWRGGSWVN
ncbi:hypothetical protein QN382_00765 [Pseudomonas sp. 10B1]|uniref:hypothetical protein n=1 Tax=unclassified Pseudomonas TaxID=196821 RepID=UPI002AB557F8|nr:MULTISPECIES: hypothetical protein [unclassified Pseudomonas]MDY7560626.1 hypothetical protein [Pseudomonas sp. AB6]MEA9993382.1 hypothetical protein [Pseudomonas sp. AA4]MEB0088368.1 hypothetical protein [Pseudomonas sp. RTI1]MEB0124131.1 hypothetical protein [Pseudomonas sp. CCC1.2]MEB0152590.1 hypothetical protein [Pseudomonas sp. CCC4.3]